jgi:hypothetical protein
VPDTRRQACAGHLTQIQVKFAGLNMPTDQDKPDQRLNDFWRKSRVSALLCALALSACSVMSSSPSADNENSSMYVVPTIGYYVATGLSAQDISKSLLNLILGIRSPEDISPETITRYTGLKVWFNSNNKNEYGVTGEITEVWDYYLSTLFSEGPNGKPNSLMFEFNDQTHDDADMSPVCVPLEFFSIPLTAAGFTAEWRSGAFPNRPYDWQFSRGKIMAVISRRGKKTRWDTQTCVHRMTIYSNISKGN